MLKKTTMLAQRPLIVLSLLALTTLVAHAQSRSTSEYTISIDKDRPRTLKIHALIPVVDGRLSMQSYGADQFPKRWAEFVGNIKAIDELGTLLQVNELPDAAWEVSARNGQRIRLSYEARVDHDQHKWAGGIDGVAFSREGNLFAAGRTFLITSGDPKDISISFQLPPGWRVSASWTPTQKSQHRFTARNRAELLESMFLAGKHEEFNFKRSGFELTFAIGGEGLQRKKAEFQSLASGALDYYIRLMGGVPKPPPARPFKRALVVINPGEDTDGEVIGNHISMILNPAGDAQSQLFGKFIFAHEFFHLWNGKSINVATTGEDWFKEGVTSYYTLKALHHIGAITEEEFLSTISGLFYKRYAEDPGLGKSSMRDVASGMDKDKHWGLVYGGGLFAGICQDTAIRTATGNTKSLDNLIRDLYDRLAGTDKTYTTTDLQSSISKVSGKDQTGFFQRYILGTDRLPLEQCFGQAGLSARVNNGELKISRTLNPSTLEKAVLTGMLGK